MKKTYLLSVLILSSFFFTACPKKEVVEPIEEAPCLAYLTFSSPKSFFANVDGLLDAVGMRAFAGMFLAQYGYPEFPEFDPEAPITIFFLDNPENPENPNVLVFAKFLTDGFTAEMISAQGLNYLAWNDWTLVCSEPLVSDNLDRFTPLIPLASAVPAHPISGKFYMQGMLKNRSKLLQNFRDALAIQEWDSSKLDLEKLAEISLNEAEDVKYLSFSVDFSREKFAYQMTIDARQGTPLGKALQSAKIKPVKEQAFISKDYTIQSIANLNYPAWAEYNDHWLTLLRPLVGQEYLPEFDKLAQQIKTSLDLYHGTTAMGACKPSNLLDSVTVTKTNASSESTFEEIANISTLVNKVTSAANANFTITTTPNVETFEGVDIHSMTVAMPEELSSSSFADAQTSFFAVADGYSISTSDLTEMKSIINAVQKGGLSDEESIALTLSANQSVLVKMDYINYGLALLQQIASSPTDKKAITILEALREQNIPPATINLEIADSDASLSVEIPIEKLLKVLVPLVMAN